MSDREQLQAIETRCTTLIGNGRAITAAEADELWRLRDLVGEQWDATNGRWLPIDA